MRCDCRTPYQVPNTIRRFLDTEARDDDDDDDYDGDEEEEEGLIDDSIVNAGSSALEPRHHRPLTWQDLEGDSDDIQAFLDGLRQMSKKYNEMPGSAILDPGDDAFDQMLRAPSAADYPLWRVRCKVGLEEDIVFSLLRTAVAGQGLRSAFTRGSLRGWIYVEAILTPEVIGLLERTPGIIRTRHGLVRDGIDISEWTKMLTMKTPNINVKLNDWARVEKGAYKGDAAFVVAIQPWGVEALLLPRLHPPVADPSRKRKRSRIPPPSRLFDPVEFHRIFHVEPRNQGNGTYTAKGYTFEHGLLRKRFDFHSVSATSVDIPIDIFQIYKHCEHPRIEESNFPRPREWVFEEGERVRVPSLKETGTILAIGANDLEVDLEFSGVHSFSWYQVQKDINVGDFVKILSGQYFERTGWVVSVMGQHVSIMEERTTSNAMNALEAHLNLLKITTPAFQHASDPSGSKPIDRLFKTDPIPWVGVEVTVKAIGHPLKGTLGTVKGVLHGQDTRSGLKIEMEVKSYNPSNPFQRILLDYDDVVESR